MFYVRVDQLNDRELGFHGYTKVGENAEFDAYRHYTGELYILSKKGKRYLMVEDINDAVSMSPTEVIQLP